MLISLQKRFVLISNAKAGSTSLEEVLAPYAEITVRRTKDGKHMPWLEARQRFHFLFDHPDYQPETFFRFAVIRDPLDRFVSWYNYRLDPTRKTRELEEMSIEEFWKRDDWIKFDRKGEKKLQRNVFKDEDGVIRFDLLLPLDMMTANQARLGNRLKIDLKIPRANVSHKMLSKSDLNPDFAAEVREFYKEDYELLAEWRPKVVEVLGEDSLRWVKEQSVPGLDQLNIVGMEDPSAGLSGLAVPAADLPQGSTLVLRQRGENIEINWNWAKRSSPEASAEGNAPRGPVARFRLPRAAGRIVAGAELALLLPDGTARVLATMKKRPPAVKEKAAKA